LRAKTGPILGWRLKLPKTLHPQGMFMYLKKRKIDHFSAIYSAIQVANLENWEKFKRTVSE
jgi:hypothetical protein